MPMISSGYTPEGGNSLTTQGLSTPSMPGFGGGMPFDPTAAIRARLRQEAEQKAFENQLREREMRMREQQAKQQKAAMAQGMERQRLGDYAGTLQPERVDPLDAIKAQDAYEMTVRGGATRPTGLGAQMIPGMAVDPNRLPSRLRPSGSSFQGAPGASGAALSPSAPEEGPSSHRGFDFADPYTQSRVQQAAFGGQPARR